MKFSSSVEHGLRTSRIDFCGDPEWTQIQIQKRINEFFGGWGLAQGTIIIIIIIIFYLNKQ